MGVVRLIEISAVQQFEDEALRSPNLRSTAGAVGSDAFSRLTKSLFGVNFADFGPRLPPNYGLDEDGYYFYKLDHDETPEDLAAWSKFEQDAETFAAVYVGLTARSEADLLKVLRTYGWDATDQNGRPLYSIVPIAPLLVASARGDFGIPKLGEIQTSPEDWAAAMAEEAANFRPKR